MKFILLMIVLFVLAYFIQKNVDQSYQEKMVYWDNLDVIKYVFAIIIIICHLRPFQGYSNDLDYFFNSVISRITVPMYFMITGYFVGMKELQSEGYIIKNLQRLIPNYLKWSLIYIPITIAYLCIDPSIIPIQLNLSLPMFLLLLPLVLVIALGYLGVFYHLWYYPAVIGALLCLNQWKKRWPIKTLLWISFGLILFGVTETYYGILPKFLTDGLSYYYQFFYTTRNFLFFGLFYVVLGYTLGQKQEVYQPYCVYKLVISVILFLIETSFIRSTARLNSNIWLMAIPVTYYLFITLLYFKHTIKLSKTFRSLSKYYYLMHPMIIFGVSLLPIFQLQHPYMQIFITILVTHGCSLLMIKGKQKLRS